MSDVNIFNKALNEKVDTEALSYFAVLMELKMRKSRDKGRGGWFDPKACSDEKLRRMMVEHVLKGHWVDVANFCMMLNTRETIPEELKALVAGK
jgi:hypothetical protein